MALDDRYLLAGYGMIATGLWAAVYLCLQGRPAGAVAPPEAVARAGSEFDWALLFDRFLSFTAVNVAGAGLVDGVNPCAFATLVFFISLLAAAKIQGRWLLLVGGVFCAASFATYFAIGFGLLRALHGLQGFPALRRAVNLGMIALLLIFAALSFRDAWRFRISRQAEAVTLQLPSGFKQRIHAIMRRGLKAPNLVAGAFVIGALVTALESVCTGQVYVPTLVYIVKSGTAVGRALGLLLLYNLAFILPLVAVFLLTYGGLRLPTLVEWSRRQVVIGKILLGVFFLAMAVLLGWLAVRPALG
jgi:thiol:disulfide interchange protein